MSKPSSQNQQAQPQIEAIKAALAEENFQPLLIALKPVLKTLYGTDPTQPELLMKALGNIHQLPKDEWYVFFTVFMADIISHTDTGSKAFFDAADFAWVTEVEQCYPAVQAEFTQVANNVDALPAFQQFHEVQHKITDDNKWKVLAFQAYGEMFNDNLSILPATANLLSYIPNWTTGMFSILMPGKKIPPHEGPYKGVLRYHLGLTIPDECGINVNGETRHWQAGKSLLFDDTFEHFAWNNSDERRAVLFVDVMRPLPFPLNILNEWVILDVLHNSDFIQKSIDKSAFEYFQGTLQSEHSP